MALSVGKTSSEGERPNAVLFLVKPPESNPDGGSARS